MSNEIIYCYRGTDGDNEPKKLKCLTKFGWPNYCIDEITGEEEQMFVNTHFKTEKEAWNSIVESVNACIKLEGRAIVEARKHLQNLIDEAAKSSERYYLVMNNKNNPFKL